jgi:Domain of unknown function (DUF4157)
LTKAASPLAARPAQPAAGARVVVPARRRADASRARAVPRTAPSSPGRAPSQAAPLEFGRIAVEHRPAEALDAATSPPRRRADRPSPAPPPRRARLRPRSPAPRPARERDGRARAGIPGGPSPPVNARDPAALIESVRATEPRSALPILDALGRALRVPLGQVEVYRGGAARRACEALGARALAASHVLLFADDAPSLATVAHELAHVLQQRGHRSPVSRFEPGSLAVAARDAPPEREAEEFARAGGPAWRLSRAPAAVYRASEPPGLDVDEEDLDDARERRFQTFLKKVKGEELGLAVRKPPVFCQEKDETDPKAEAKGQYKRSSGRKFAHADYVGVLGASSGVLDGELPAIWNLRGKWRLSKVGFKEEEARKYAVTGSDTYQETIYEVATPERKEPTPEDNAQALRDYRTACQAIDNKKIRAWERSWKPPVANKARVTADELGKARDEMEGRIVKVYADDVDALFDEVIEPAVFAPPYTRIQGNIFEKWVKENRPGWQKGSGQPLFKDKRLTKDRYGDLVIQKGSKLVVGEVKGVAGKPGKEQLQQIADYFIILTRKPPIQGRYLEDPEDSKSAKTVTFSAVKYFFPTREVAQAWMPALLNGFKRRTDIFQVDPAVPKTLPKKKRTLRNRANPFIDVVVDDADDATHLTHRLENPPVKNAGLKVDFFEVTFEEAGYPAITSGQLSLQVDVKGGALASEKPTPKKLTPLKPGQEPPPGSSELDADLVATTENGVADVKPSGLDKFLKNVHAEVKLTDDGLGGRIWADPAEFVAKMNLVKAEIAAGYTLSKGFEANGTVEVSYAPDPAKFKGGVTVKYHREKWSFLGQATVGGLIAGLEPFDVLIKHEDDVTTIGAKNLALQKKFAAVQLKAAVPQLSYDVETGGFSAEDVTVTAVLGAFGTAEAKATIRNNEIADAELKYTSPDIQLPKKNPAFVGKLEGTIRYSRGQVSADVGGDVFLRSALIKKLSPRNEAIALHAAISIADGEIKSGSIGLAKPVAIGKHFELPKLDVTIARDGSFDVDGVLRLVGIKNLKEAQVGLGIDDRGLHVKQASIEAVIGAEGKDRFWGTLLVSAAENEGLRITADAHVKIKEGLIAEGRLTYDAKEQTLSGKLGIREITLFRYGPVERSLLELHNQIELISFYHVIGLYLDLGFDLKFTLHFDLKIRPTVELEGLDLETFEFKRVRAIIELIGQMLASLGAYPSVGLGVFVISTKLLRGGGGIVIPIVGTAKLQAGARFGLEYLPGGEVTGGARVGLQLTFGIDAAVRPYAEFVVLDGAWKPRWDGEPLASFVLLPERELFTYVIDFGEPLPESPVTPKLPPEGKPQSPAPVRADRRIEKDKQPAAQDTALPPRKEAQERGNPDKGAEGPADSPDGFSLAKLVQNLKQADAVRPVFDALEAAGEVWDFITGALGRIWKAIKNWFGDTIDALKRLFKGIKAAGGFFNYLKQVLKEKLGDDLFYIIEPLLNALGGFEQRVYELLETPLPDSFGSAFTWIFKFIWTIVGGGFDTIVQLARAVKEVVSRAGEVALKFVNYLVQSGRIGVKRSTYSGPLGSVDVPDTYKIKIGGISFARTADEGSFVINADTAIGAPLWAALTLLGADRTSNGEFWVDKADDPAIDKD